MSNLGFPLISVVFSPSLNVNFIIEQQYLSGAVLAIINRRTRPKKNSLAEVVTITHASGGSPLQLFHGTCMGVLFN